ncbi:MAG TPA: c-type cytochrome [Tepidisphaeraceae bacterium]|nr:c-type cytochrome [Tepidisphaeraceae bacterium]
MPIPTDTFWNIKRLNWIFAVSAIVLMAVTGWSIIQDYDKDWRRPQRNTRVWESALTEERIDRETTPEKQERLQRLQEQIAAQEKALANSADELKRINAQIAKITSDRSNLEFQYNSAKALVTVDEAQLQDAITANETERANALRAKLAEPRKRVEEQSEQLAALNEQLAELREQLAEKTRTKTELERERTKLTADIDLLQKKLIALDPSRQQGLSGWLGWASAKARSAPLLQFVNPSERVQQVVLSDVQTDLGGVKRVEAIDRCMTCHVNIANKEFTEANLLAFLEEQVASSRKLNLPEIPGGRTADPVATVTNPGPVAMPEFWHAWARQLAPAALARNTVRINAVTGIINKPAIVTVDGQKLETFKYDLKLIGDARDRQDAIFRQVLRALLAYPQTDKRWVYESANGAPSPRVVVEIPVPSVVEEKALATARNTAIRYVEELANALRTTLAPKQFNLLEDRYRTAMVEEVNADRRRKGYEPLDPSPVYLAHPNLQLYVDVDSPHSFERVGCTSCHDGSGVETDFVLAAHTPRAIWVDQKTGTPVLPEQIKPKRALVTHLGPDLSSMLAAVYPPDALVPQLSSLHLNLATHYAPATQPVEHADAKSSAQPQTADSQVFEAFEVPEEAPVDAPPTPYVDPVSGKEGRAVSQLTHWKKYEPKSGTSFKDVNHYWDRPMLPPQYLQANCVRCHTDVYDIKDTAPVIHEGRMLFKNMGCVNCHQMDSITPEVAPSNTSDERLVLANGQRKVGTDLRHITAKLSPAMINTWIWSPKAFRPSTKMPHFFMLENNSSDEELRRTRQEARAITEYLIRTAAPLPPKHLPPQGLTGDLARGQAVFNNIGCLGCHSNLNDPVAKSGDKTVTLGEQWIVTDLVKAGRLADELAARLGKAPDTKTLTAEAQKIYQRMTYNERQLYALEHLGEKGEQTAPPRYPDNSPKPVFMHHGPELSGIGTKLTAGGRTSEEARQWLFDWLKEPRHYSEYTLMPRLRLSDQQAIDLVEYLLSMKRANDAPNDTWTAGLTSPDSVKLQEMTAMFLRSRFSSKKAMEKADEDAELSYLAADALKPSDADPAAFDALKEETAKWSKDERRMVFLGKKLIGHYGCMSCHAINGAETLTSPCANLSDWGQKALSQIAFDFLDHHKIESMPKAQHVAIPMVNGLSADIAKLTEQPIEPGTAKPVEVAWPHVEHSRTSWLTQKLKNTRIYDRGKVLLEPRDGDAGRPYDKLKMPTFYFTDREVDAIVTFVISNRDRLITPRLTNETRTEEAQQIAQGRQLAEKYNCINCHQIEQNVPVVQQWYKADELTSEAPPSLRGEGNKVQHAWLFGFLKDVEPLRPLLHSDTEGGGGNRKIDIRMPSFPLQDAEIAALAAYFASVSNKESNKLAATLDPVVRYVHEQMDASDEPLYAESPWPGDDWHRRPEFANAAEALVEWATTRDQVTPVQLDPTRNNAYELGRTFRGLLFKARFTQHLYDAPYPFTDAPRPQISEERFKRGESFLYEMQCLKCHVLGDPNAEGSQKNPTAPNLNLVYRRLQPRWVRRWVQEPAVIQAKTMMPPFLSGAPIYHLDGLPFPRGQGGEPDERIESMYGETADEQGQLLLDFLYAAGVRNYTGIQPAQPGPLAGVTPIARASRQAATQAATQVSTAPAPIPQPLAMHPEFDKPILPGKAPEIAKPVDTAIAEKPVAPTVAGVKLAGKVMFTGTPPALPPLGMGADAGCSAQHTDAVPDPSVMVSEKGELQNVVVSVEGVAGTFPTLSTPAVLDQRGCMYVPHVLAAQVGQPIVVKNSDPFLHNVHALSTINPAFNFGQNKDPGRNIGSMKAPEVFRVKCDVHPWMSANFHIFEHPFFAVSAADGSFSIENVPPGTYKLTATHERFGTQTKDVTVEAGKPLAVEFTFGDATARFTPSPVVKLMTMAMLSAGSAPAAAVKPPACPSCAPQAETQRKK